MITYNIIIPGQWKWNAISFRARFYLRWQALINVNNVEAYDAVENYFSWE